MHKTENGLMFPSDDSSEEIFAVKQCLQDIGFSALDVEWLVHVFKRQDCFGDPNGVSIFNDEFSVHFEEHILPCAVEVFSEPVQAEKNQQTRLAFLFHSLLGFGRLGGKAWLPNVGIEVSDDSTDIPEWVQRISETCDSFLPKTCIGTN